MATTALSALTLTSMLLTRSLGASLAVLAVGAAAAMLWAIDRARHRDAATAFRAGHPGRTVPPVLSLLAPRATAGESETAVASSAATMGSQHAAEIG